MQRVRVVQWSLDNKYIISGSDEMNIRVWKARASEKLGMVRINNRINGGFLKASISILSVWSLVGKFGLYSYVTWLIPIRDI